MRRTGHLIIIAALLMGLTAGGCVTPVIPLPPPDTDNMVLLACDSTAGTISFRGDPGVASGPGLFLYLLNLSTNSGKILQVDHAGGFPAVTDFPAKDGVQMHVWTRNAPFSQESSAPTQVKVDCAMSLGKGNGFVKSM